MSNLVFGSLLVLIGVTLIFKAIFGIDIPVLRILLGLLIIYWGTTVLTNRSCSWVHKAYTSKNYPHNRINIHKHAHEYSVVFSSNTIDLRTQNFTEKPARVKVDTVFGSATVIIPNDIPVAIHADAVFGSVTLPEATTFMSANENQEPQLVLHINTVFGSVDIKTQ